MSVAGNLALSAAPPATPRKPRRRARVVLVLLAVLLAVLVVTQIALPPIAARVVRESLEPRDHGVTVSVSSFPAIKLLFGHADSASVHIAQAQTSGGGGLEGLLARARRVNTLTATVGTMRVGPLEFSHVYMRKQGSNLSAQATVSPQAIRNVLPPGFRVDAGDAPGGGLRLTVATTVLPRQLSVGARLAAQNGALEIAPELPLLDLVHVSVFDDPKIAVTSVSVRSAEHGTYTVDVRGRYG